MILTKEIQRQQEEAQSGEGNQQMAPTGQMKNSMAGGGPSGETVEYVNENA